MFSSGLLIFTAIVAAILFWLDGARAREMATALAQELCRRYQVQFLDGSAALESIRLRRIPEGLRFRRVFSFSYSTDDEDRQQGSVTIVGGRITAFQLQGRTTVEG